jgi:hypothetical protein
VDTVVGRRISENDRNELSIGSGARARSRRGVPRQTAALAAELGDKKYRRFFSEAEFEAITAGVVYLRTPAPIDARIITKDYQEVLVRHWRAEDASVRSVVVNFGRLRRTG